MDSNYEDDYAAVASALFATIFALMWYRWRRINLPWEPYYNRDGQRTNYISRIINSSDAASISMLRMRRASFFGLCDLLKAKGLLYNTLHVSVEEQVAMFLHIVGHNVRNRVVGVNFLQSGEAISRYFNHVLYAIGELRGELIQPSNIATSPIITQDPRFMPYFKDCIGALDGTHIQASVPNDIVARFRGRKPYPTQKVLAAINFELRFTYVLAGWEGSAHDALVFRNALEREDRLVVPKDKYYLVGAGYSTRPGFISPYRGVRYHLKEFSARTPTTRKELFNYRHSLLRTSVERAFGALKNRFKILTSKPFFPFQTQVEIVIACCILHNYILQSGHDMFVPNLEDWEPNPNVRDVRTPT